MPAQASPPPAVLQVTPALTDGGAQTSAIEMALYLNTHGYTPHVASAGGPGEAALQAAHIAHHRLPLGAKLPWTILANAVRLTCLYNSHGIRLVHARSRAPAWSAWLACRLQGILHKCVPTRFHHVAFLSTYHGTYGTQGFLKKWYNGVMLRGPYVIANSGFIRDHLIQAYQVEPARIIVAPRGIEPAAFNPAAVSREAVAAALKTLDAPADVPLLLLVGRLTRWKGQALFIEALAELTRLSPNLEWYAALVGAAEARDHTYAEELRQLIRTAGLEARIAMPGSLKNIPALNKAATLALSCSIEPEAFGRTAIEAQAIGTPVIATALGGSLETVVPFPHPRATGWLIPPTGVPHGKRYTFAPQVLAKTIHHALTNPKQLQTMGQYAREHVLSRFTVEACCAAEEKVYPLLLGRDTRP